jgi:hypothetical protein
MNCGRNARKALEDEKDQIVTWSEPVTDKEHTKGL